jgi:hypothetical protein
MSIDLRIAEYLILLREPSIQLVTRLRIGEERILITKRKTTILLKAKRGSEQSQSTNSSTA